MPFEFHSASQAEPAYDGLGGQHSNGREQIITVLAASLAVLIVAAIAVLIGMV